MCGIAGLIRYGKDAVRDMDIMKTRMAHRGPDDDGTWYDADDDVVLGHRRLAVVDLTKTGAQPMLSKSTRFVIAYNGEIYNAYELKEQLGAKGIRSFRGTSDTELLLESLEHLGIEETLRIAKGMFAVALYDRQEKTLTLIRDRIGEKPLYYGFVDGAFVFASDLGSIRALPRFKPRIFRDVLPLYFAHGYIPAPYTVYEGIRKLKPGCLLTIRTPYTEDAMQTRPYWDLSEIALRGKEHPFQGSLTEAATELERLMKSAVRDQMEADVPVGAFLSGGIDSATTVALMQAVSPGQVKSFTIGMEESAYDEAPFAKEIAAHLHTTHTELYISEADAKAVIPLLPRMFAEPFADSSQIPTYLVSKMTRSHVTVSLSGDGGDELFGGYTTYRHAERIWRQIRGIPLPLRRMTGKALRALPRRKPGRLAAVGNLVDSTSPESLYRNFYLPRDRYMQHLTAENHAIPYPNDALCAPGDSLGSVTKDLMRMNMMMYHPDDILVKVDRCAMAVSLETRVPLLDRDVVEFAWTLPEHFLTDGTKGKLILRDVLYRHVPESLMERPKKGFSVPVQKWLKEKTLSDWAQELLREDKIREQGFLNAASVNRVWKDYAEKNIWRNQLWFLLMFQAWLEEEYVAGGQNT